jgi:uroporphyrinogen-III decarboxylase
MVAYHCHGNITHALARFVEMGVDMTDPVETTPDGNLSLCEARRLASDQLTLIGNVQIRDMAQAQPAAVREKVRTIIEEAGPSHVIITTTGTPLEKMDKTTENNYHALIDAVLEFGSRT